MKQRTAALLLSAGLGLAGAGTLAPTAAAAPAPTTAPTAAPSAAAATTATGIDAASEQRTVTDYWTPERMQAARPGHLLAPEPGTGNGPAPAKGAPQAVQGSAGGAGTDQDIPFPKAPGTESGSADTGSAAAEALASPTADGVRWTGAGRVVDTTGKVFFTQGGADYVCSASSVTSQNRSTVLTAGHCLFGAGSFATRFTFVPAYEGGSAPYGQWTARALATTPEYRASEDLNFDVGFAVLNATGGRTLADAVGAQGIAFNQARGQQMYGFGYPAGAPYDGETLQYCSGVVRADTFGGSSDQGLTCRMTGGSSGGPWYLSFSEATGIGTANSVNSFMYNADPSTMYGPYFGAEVQSTYAAAQSA